MGAATLKLVKGSNHRKEKAPVQDDYDDEESPSSRKYKSAEELLKLSKFATRKNALGGSFDSNRDRLEALLEITEDSVAIMEGLFKSKPTQGQAYALTNLMGQLQSIVSQINQVYNFHEVGETVVQEAIDPAIEQMLIILSQLVSETVKNLDLSPSDRKLVKKALNVMLRTFAGEVDKMRGDLQKQVVETLIDQQ